MHHRASRITGKGPEVESKGREANGEKKIYIYIYIYIYLKTNETKFKQIKQQQHGG